MNNSKIAKLEELPNLKEKLAKIRILVMDVDGTLTDGGMYYTDSGEAMKRFTTRDGMGITLLHRAGIETAIMTSENIPIVSARAEKLKIPHVRLGVRNKKEEILRLSAQLSLALDVFAYIGDDINDEQPIRLCGASACPSDAVEVISSLTDYICTARGGYGAVREFAELILTAQGKPITLTDEF